MCEPRALTRFCPSSVPAHRASQRRSSLTVLTGRATSRTTRAAPSCTCVLLSPTREDPASPQRQPTHPRAPPAVFDAPARQVPRGATDARPAEGGASPPAAPPRRSCPRRSPDPPCPLPQVILAKIRLLSQSHVVHSGLSYFASHPGTEIDPAQVPGLRESGWTPEMDELCVALVLLGFLCARH